MAALSSLCGGALCGFLLSASRAPRGLDLVGLPAAAAADAALFRAAALLAIALGLSAAPPRALGAWLAGAALGYALHGLVLFHVLWVDGCGVEALLLAVTAAALALRYSARGDEPDPGSRGGAWIARAGLGLGAAGVALALESLARPLRLFGRGLPSDDSAFGLALLAATALGALAFGPLLTRAARTCLPLLLVAAAAAGRDGLGFLATVGDNLAFEGYLRSFGVAPYGWGGLACDALLGARVFVLPGFFLGAALACVRERRELTSVLVGAALGTLAMPWLVQATAVVEPDAIARAPAVRVGVGAALAAAGAALVLFTPAPNGTTAGKGWGGRFARAAGAAVALGLAAAVGLAPAPRTLAYRQHELLPLAPTWVGEVPAGVLMLGPVPHQGPRLALDGRALTPSAAGRADEALVLGALPIPARRGGRVLLLGQLTPARAQALVEAGASVIDRTGAWHALMPAIEQAFFEDLARPPGAVLSPAEARREIASESYDLVVAPPVEGYPSASRAVLRCEDALAWSRADTPLAGRDLGPEVLLAARDFEHLAVGSGGAVVARRGADELALFPSGPARAPLAPWAELRDPRGAAMRHLVDTTGRLAAAAGGPGQRTAQALALLARAQRKSAVWDTEAESTEIDPAALELLREALLARAGPLRQLERSLAEYLAGVCVGKREIEWLYAYFEPLVASAATAGEPWPALQRSLLAADVESLDFEGALARLGPLLAESPGDVALWRLSAAAHLQTGDPQQAARDLRAASTLDPASRVLERELAMMLIRAGDPEGLDRAEELLRADPEDSLLALYCDAARGAAPMPPLPDPPRAVDFLPPG